MFEIEPGFSEEDLLWEPKVRESHAHVEKRAKEVLDMMFKDDKEICGSFCLRYPQSHFILYSVISVTAHGGIINALLVVLGRTSYALPTGGNILPFPTEALNLMMF
jgi:hypothetical protein